MSRIPFANILLERISDLKNTNLKFKNEYININEDIGELNKHILSTHYEMEVSTLKMGNKHIKETNETTKEILNSKTEEWYKNERSVIPDSIIRREIDKICLEENLYVSASETEQIIDIVSKNNIKEYESISKSAVSSIMSLLQNQRSKINESVIMEKLTEHIRKKNPEQLVFLEDTFKERETERQLEQYLEQRKSEPHEINEKKRFQYTEYSNFVPVVTKMAGKMKSDIYEILTENIYNTLLRDPKTESPLDFNAIKIDTATHVKRIAKKLQLAENKDEVIEKNIKKTFNSKIEATLSSPEQDINNLFEMLNRGNISDQRYELKNNLYPPRQMYIRFRGNIS